MRAGLRWALAYSAAALWLGSTAALAQNAPPTDAPAVGTAPAPVAVGPKELQNFSIDGQVTRPADQPVTVKPAPTARQPRAEAQPVPTPQPSRSATAASSSPATPAPEPARTETASKDQTRSERAPEPLRQTSPASSVTVALPNVGKDAAQVSSTTPAPTPASFAPEPATTPASLAPEHGLSLFPWLLAAIALGAGAAFLFLRNRPREAFAGGPQVDAFVAPEPAPRAAPPPQPAPAPPQSSPPLAGIVSTRLRPWIDIGFRPSRCILDDQKVSLEFEVELFNSGSAPARAVLAEASLFNAGPTQDQDIERFIDNPVGEGERIVAIAPLQRVQIKTQVSLALDQVQAYELAGKQVFVPLIAFNALYRWSGGEGQTSVSYLLGRDTKGEKMGPFRLDLGPRLFRGIAARLLPAGVRK